MFNNSQLAKRIALATAVVAGAAGIYYLCWKSYKKGEKGRVSKEQVKLENMTVLQLKELGNKLFAARKYANAIEVFTKAIDLDEADTDKIKAMCYQNRAAAKEFLGDHAIEEIISDCSSAIAKNPFYGKAYIRRAKNLQKAGNSNDALTDLFAATHVDPELDKQVGQYLSTLVEEMLKFERAEWMASLGDVSPVTPVRHERVYAWLKKMCINDPIRNDVIGFDKVPECAYERAIQLIKEKHFDSVPACAEKEEGPKKLHALLLAARFYVYKNQRDKAIEILSRYDEEFSLLIESDSALQSAKLALVIEMALTKEEVLSALETAIAHDKRNPDFYTTAAFRLTLLQELGTAKDVINKEGIPEATNVSLMRLMIDILVAVSAQDMSGMHNGILALENYVKAMENEKSPYALSLMAKIYSLFQNPEGARRCLNELLEAEGEESSHWFDSGMLATDESELVAGLKKCLALEPHHAEANLMMCSMKVNSVGPRALTGAEFDECWSCIQRATEVIDRTPDIPASDGIFRMRVVLKAKRSAGEKFGI